MACVDAVPPRPSPAPALPSQPHISPYIPFCCPGRCLPPLSQRFFQASKLPVCMTRPSGRVKLAGGDQDGTEEEEEAEEAAVGAATATVGGTA